jgi:hypothetical protein
MYQAAHDLAGFRRGAADTFFQRSTVMDGFSSFRNVSLVLATLVGGYLVWTAYSGGPAGLLRHSIQSVTYAIR